MKINRHNTLLHIIDAQEKLFQVMHRKEWIKDNMVRMVKGTQVLDVPIIWMEQYPQGLGSTVHEIKDLLPPENRHEKMCFSSCNQPDFLLEINKGGRNNILVMGIEAHVCVYQTVKDLLANGFRVEVIADAVSSRTEQNYEIALRKMESLGAKLTSVEMALFELLGSAGTDEFKKISRIIK